MIGLSKIMECHVMVHKFIPPVTINLPATVYPPDLFYSDPPMPEGLAKEPTSGNPVKSSDCLITSKKWICSMMLNQ